jgi:hypothetical protein
MKFAKAQVDGGRFFLFDQPWSAWSWSIPTVSEVVALPEVQVMEGLLGGQRTGWMTNGPCLAEAVSEWCRNTPRHEPHAAARVAQERYPPELVTAVLKALRMQLRLGGSLGALEVGQTVEEEELLQTAVKGGPYKDVLDRVTGQILDGGAVAKAREEEMVYMKALKVYEHVSEQTARETSGRPPISVDWVDINKGDETRPELRSRLVAQETRRVSTLGPEDAAAIFAATPPLEALRFMLSLAMTEQAEDRLAEVVLAFLDISRAHLHSPIRRDVFVKACKEDVDCPEGYCWKLLKAMYGLRDAGAAFDKKVEVSSEAMGFKVGLFSPCLCYNPATKVRFFRHGDDFVVLGSRAAVKNYAEELGKYLIVKVRGVLGPRKDLGDVQEIVILNRIVRWVPGDKERIEMEADARHPSLLAQQLGLTAKSKPVASPGVKDPTGQRGAELDAERHSIFRSAAMRLAYLAQDRPEMAFAAKEVARCMSCPDEAAWQALKRAARFCMGHPRVVWEFEKQHPVTFLDVWSDSDHAGCLRTRKSTSCSMLMVGCHLLRGTATTQTVISLSSGESEFYGLVKSASIALGAEAMALDLGVVLKPRVRYDATAGAGIANRRGVGRVRHLHTPSLWVQRYVQEGRLTLSKVPGEKNVADIGTKHLDGKRMWMLLGLMGLRSTAGRSELSLRVAGEVMA